MKLTQYTPGYKLKENEFMLKVRGKISKTSPPTGFMTKYNQNGSMPKAFEEWGVYRYSSTPQTPLDIWVMEETFRSGWKLNDWRIGKSQEWAEVIHPEGFIVEIYLTDFLTHVKTGEIKNGELIGKFKWQDRKLIKEA